jgi:DNA-binding YbaB/EbfC family protein
VAGDQPAIQDLVKKAEALREQLALAKFELAEMEVTGSAEGGLVTVTMRGDGQVTRVVFDQAAVDEGDAKRLAALTMTAISRATDSLKSSIADRMAALTAGFSIADPAGPAGSFPPRM